jgi:hypothetical protein
MADTDDQVVLAQITITRVLTGDDIVDQVVASAADGTSLGLAEALGMIELSKFTLMDCYGEDDEAE